MFRLALRLGKTVRELGATLSIDELTEWLAYSRIEPFGFDMDNWRTGVIASTVHNSQAAQKSQLLKPSDFYPNMKKEKQMLTPENFRNLIGG